MAAMFSIQRREWLFPAVLALAFIAIGSLPYSYGYDIAPEDSEFMGFVGRGTPGANSYLAFARQAAEGRNGFTNLYTPASPGGAYYNPEWWVMGRAAQWAGLSLIAAFHVGRALSVLAFALAAYYLCAVSLRGVGRRRAALLLITCGTGLGWVLYAVNAGLGTSLALSLDAQGVNIFGHLVNKPHFIRAGVFAALQYAWFIRGEQTGRTGYFALSGLAAAGHSLIRPYHIPEALLFLLLYGVLRVWARPENGMRLGFQLGLCALCHGPVILWHALVYLKNPLGLHALDAWNSVFFLPLLLWLGLPFAALCGFVLWQGYRRAPVDWRATPVLALWLLTALLLAQCHPYFQWGVESYFPWVLAPPILFLRHVWPRLEKLHRITGLPPWLRGAAMAAIAAAVFPGTLLTYGKFFADLRHPESPWQYYLDRGTGTAIVWLGEHASERGVVLASHDTSQFIPRLANLRTVTGQDVLSANYRQHNAWVARFFQSPGDDGFKAWLCRELGVTHVIAGPFERAIAGAHFTPPRWLEPLRTFGETTVYAVWRP